MANGPPRNKARIVRKNCETMKFATQLVADPMAVPIPRTDSGKISPINNQAIGPHEMANPKLFYGSLCP